MPKVLDGKINPADRRRFSYFWINSRRGDPKDEKFGYENLSNFLTLAKLQRLE
jgi:hypothetical protein